MVATVGDQARHGQRAMVNVPDYTPIAALRRQADSPLLWVSLIAGSLLLHVVLFWILRLYWLRQVNVQLRPAPISVEFVTPPKRSTTFTSSTALQPSNRSRSGDRPSNNGGSYRQPERVSASASPPVATPPPPVEPSPLAPSPVVAPRPPRRSPVPPPASPRPLPETGDRAAVPSPTPTALTDNGTNDTGTADDRVGNNSPASGQPEGDQGPVASGIPLPRTQSAATVEMIGSPYQKQDRKDQPARPQQSTQELSIYYPGRISQPIEIEAHLEIDASGKVLAILNVEQLSTDVDSIEPDQLRRLAEQIFRTWNFEPARDGNPPQPVLSDLFIRARITLR